MTKTLHADIVGEDLRLPHPQWGEIFVRNRRPAGVSAFSPERIVVMQHGATYGGSAFDIPFGGLSWMEYLAARGFDAYSLDLPGYGRSERPPQMSVPAEENPPFMRTPDAARCLGFVCDHIRERRSAARLNLIGWSWGTSITASYTAAHSDLVARLVLYAPVWHRTGPEKSPVRVEGALGAYRTVAREATLARRQAGLSEAEKERVMPREWFDQWWAEVTAADPDGKGETIRAPNGVVQDGREYWEAGKALYDPARIEVPVLVTVGELDRDTPVYMAQTLFPLLTGAPWRRLSVLSGGTHAILMESHRMLLFRGVQQFLEEAPPGPDALA